MVPPADLECGVLEQSNGSLFQELKLDVYSKHTHTHACCYLHLECAVH